MPKHCELHNLEFKRCPKDTEDCPCGKTKLPYNICCKVHDMNFKQKIIEEIEDYLKEDKISKVKMVYA